jgi:nucleoside diphosphate kinase
MLDVASVTKAVADIAAKKTKEVTLKAYNSSHATAHPEKHQLVFFFKPEITSDSHVHLKDAINIAVEALTKAHVEIGSVKILSGDYLAEHDIMVKHYGVIANISKNGESVISSSAKQTLAEKFADFPGAEVLGGHQFLLRYPDISPFALSVLNDNLGTTRLAGGTYAMKAKVVGKPYIVLNPFHAYQLVPYTTPGHSIVVFECVSSTPWADLRGKVCGVTDPKDAAEGSIRKTYLNKKSELGFKEVDKSSNGIHMSAGPLEAMVELGRFFIVNYADTSFGAALKKKGLTEEQINALAGNPLLDVGGKKVSAFDATEEKNVSEALEILAHAKLAS